MKFIKTNLNRIILIIIYILIMMVLPGLLTNIFHDKITTGEQVMVFSIVTNVVMYGILFISCIVLLRDDLKEDYKVLNSTPAIKVFLTIVIGIFGCYALLYIGNFITYLLSNSNISENESAIREMLENKGSIILIPTIAFIGPMVEEMIFRKALTSILRSAKLNDWIVILITSILFGFIHVISGGDYLQVFPYIFMGFAFGLIEKYSKTIFPSTCVHIFNNYFATAIQIIMGFF